MTRLPTRTLLSLRTFLALLSAAAAVGCTTHARGTPAASPTSTTQAGAAPRGFRLDNRGLERLDVYLLDETRDWYLGRVEPGALALLPLPGTPPSARGGWCGWRCSPAWPPAPRTGRGRAKSRARCSRSGSR